jgi:hypothetical protein
MGHSNWTLDFLVGCLRHQLILRRFRRFGTFGNWLEMIQVDISLLIPWLWITFSLEKICSRDPKQFKGKLTMRANSISRIAFLLAAVPLAYGQGTATTVGATPLKAPLVPPALATKLAALGTRFAVTGSERLTIVGSIVRPSAAAVPVHIVYQIPRKFHYSEGTKTITYDGANYYYSASPSAADTGLCESLFEDSVDGLFYNIPNASLMRNLMSRARLDDGKAKNYTGPYLDIFQLILPLPSLPNDPRRTKFFYFDSPTQLLDRVRYLSGTNGQTAVETGFKTWQRVAGSSAPSVITRTENGVLQFTLTSTSASITAAASDATFTLP